MSPIGLFFLLITAIVGSVLIVRNPINAILKFFSGKTAKQAASEFVEYAEQAEGAELLGKGCKYALFFLVSLVQGYILEPYFIIVGIVKGIGDQTFAYVAGVISLYSILYFVWHQIKKKGKKGQGEDLTEEVIPDFTKSFKFKVRRMIFAIPTVYLWYLFIVSII